MLVRNYPLSSNGDNTVTVSSDYYQGNVPNWTLTSFVDNSFRTSTFYYNSCIPGDRETNPLGPLTGNQWEIRFELMTESFPSSYSSSIITIINKNNDSITIGTGSASSTNMNLNRSIFLEWHKYIITCDGSKIKLYLDGVESGVLNKSLIWPTIERKRLLNMPYNQDSQIIILVDPKIVGNYSYLRIKNLSIYVDEVQTTESISGEIDIPTPSIPVNSEGLLIYYPLYTDYNNMITGVNTNDFRINNFTHTGGFKASVAQGGYFEGTVASIGFGIPAVDKYTSIYDTYPWMIEFDFCAPTINNKNIVTLTNNVTYGSRTVGVKTGGADTSSMCALSNSDVQTWTHIRIVNKNDRIHVYEDSLKQEFEVRGFYLDSTNVNLVFGDGSYTFRLKEVKVYYGYGDDTLERGDYEKEFYGHIYARSATSKTPLILDIPFPYPQFTEMEFFVSSTIDKRLIPDDAYDRLDENRIYISLPEVQEFNLNTEEEVRFTFCHNKGEYAVNKKEYHVRTKAGVNEYSFPSPFGKIIDMNMRMRVFYDRYLLYPDTEYKYRFDNYTGHIYIMDDTDLGGIKVENNKRLDVVKASLDAAKQKHLDSVDASKELQDKVDQLTNQNLKYKQKVNANQQVIDDQKAKISDLESKLRETVTAAKNAKRGSSNFDAKLAQVQQQLAATTKILEDYQEAYADLYASAIGVSLSNIPVTASTTVEQLKSTIRGGTNTSGIPANPGILIDEDDYVTGDEDNTLEIVDGDISDLITL